uniref:Uncharacterized protein n=1 Tax=Arundo donax TaxID=35708 RepID=A0A0A8Z9N8_ARUDO
MVITLHFLRFHSHCMSCVLEKLTLLPMFWSPWLKTFPTGTRVSCLDCHWSEPSWFSDHICRCLWLVEVSYWAFGKKN